MGTEHASKQTTQNPAQPEPQHKEGAWTTSLSAHGGRTYFAAKSPDGKLRIEAMVPNGNEEKSVHLIVVGLPLALIQALETQAVAGKSQCIVRYGGPFGIFLTPLEE